MAALGGVAEAVVDFLFAAAGGVAGAEFCGGGGAGAFELEVLPLLSLTSTARLDDEPPEVTRDSKLLLLPPLRPGGAVSGGYVAPRTCLIVPGFGFAEEELDHIFDAGFRCERAAALCFLCGGLAYAERSSHTWLLFPATTNLSWDNLCRIVPTN